MRKPRLKMVARLGPQPAGEDPGARTAGPADRRAIAELLLAAYAGTIDDDGETLEDALAEVDRTMAGAYGEYLEPCSFLVEEGGAVVAASLVTRFEGAPLLAFVMVAPAAQRRGLAERVLRLSMAALRAQGEAELALFVTDGNGPAQRLYARLGFTVVEPGAQGER